MERDLSSYFKYCYRPRSLQLTLKVICIGKDGPALFMISNWFIPFKNILGWNAVVSCACEVTLLLSVVFYVVRAAHKIFTLNLL